MTAMRTIRTIFSNAAAIAALTLAGASLTATAAQAATPNTIAVEGRLMTVAGGPITDGKYAVTFLLYASAQAKTPAWSETVSGLVVKGGGFQHALGTSKPLTASMLDGGKAGWLAVKIGAAGLFCMALPDRRLGIAIKVHSGDRQALGCAVLATLAKVAPGAIAQPPEDWPWHVVRNVIGVTVGRRYTRI